MTQKSVCVSKCERGTAALVKLLAANMEFSQLFQAIA